MNHIAMGALSVMGHGNTQELIALGLRPDLIPQQDDNDKAVARMYQEAVYAVTGGQPNKVNLTNLLSRLPPMKIDVPSMIAVWNDGHGSDAGTLVTLAKNQHVLSQYREWQRREYEFGQLPLEEQVRRLPALASELEQIAKGYQSYDPTPNLDGPVMSIVMPFTKTFLNTAFQGGVWSHCNTLIVGSTENGKTTMTITIVSDLLLQLRDLGRKVAVLKNEWDSSYYFMRLLCAAGIPWSHIVEYSKAKKAGFDVSILPSCQEIEYWSEVIKSTVRLYKRDMMTLAGIKQIVEMENPVTLFLDTIQGAQIAPSRTQSQASALEEFAYGVGDVAVNHGTWLVLYSQLTGEDERTVRKEKDLPNLRGKGSGGLGDAVRTGYLLMRDYDVPNSGWLACKKMELPPPADGKHDDVHFMYDKETMTFVDAIVEHVYL